MRNQTLLLSDLTPARWIWYPAWRVLPNTFVLFRHTFQLPVRATSATGWISADSRYTLYVNGRRLQFGPAPCDPRHLEADPIHLTPFLRPGENVIAARVFFYGHGDGTSPLGKPGFLFRLDVELEDGTRETVASDKQWLACLPQAWRPGMYKRSYVRALQEVFDARHYPHGWETHDFRPDGDWLSAMELPIPSTLPPICGPLEDLQYGAHGTPENCRMRRRTIALLHEHRVPATHLASAVSLRWSRPVEEYFDVMTRDTHRVAGDLDVRHDNLEWTFRAEAERTAALTFTLDEQVVGFPCFTIDAPAGTTVELLVHEAHGEDGPPLLNTHFHSWTRFTCREGENRFETSDYESCRWIQLHIHDAEGDVTVRDIGVRRRIYPWPNASQIRIDEPSLQRLIDASINTLHNSCQDVIVDGMARERQQYSGDCGHQLLAVYPSFGEWNLPARFITTWSQGLVADGYFLDCWPAYDRLARIMTRQIGLAGWGPILDHGVGFNFDCYHHVLYTGDTETVREVFPRLRRFVDYLTGLIGHDGLLPVENLGIPIIWMDHVAYQQQRHKQCAFNLYTAAMLRYAHAPLCRWFDHADDARKAEELSAGLLEATVRHFWNAELGAFVANQPWLEEEKAPRYCDRSLATSILFDQCPQQQTRHAADLLAEVPDAMGLSYPANAGWRLWALARAGRHDVIVKDLRERWATMDSVRLNNTLQEDWTATPDSGQQWSHCAVVPLYVLFMSLAGIRPTAPGFAECTIQPRLADLPDLDLTHYTPRGVIRFQASGRYGDRQLEITIPLDCRAELLVDEKETLTLDRLERRGHLIAYRLPPGQTSRFHATTI